MKFRTDFVTNSSSSAFCVSFNMKFKNGVELSCSFEDQDGDDGFMSEIKVGDHSLNLEKSDLYAVIEGERVELLPDDLGGVSPYDIDVFDVCVDTREHSATDVDLSSVRTAEDLLSQLVRLCELDGDLFDESKLDIEVFGDGDTESIKALILQNLKEIGVRAGAWQEAMRNEIARILDEGLQTWDDVAEATIKFEDKGWGSEAMFNDELAAMIPNGSRVIVESDSGQKLVADESNRDTIENYIDDSVVQKYVAGSEVVFVI